MRDLIFAPADLRIKKTEKGFQVWDIVRKKFVWLSPEEWVRQHLIHHLLKMGYPASLMQVEKAVQINGKSLRPDLVVYSGYNSFFLLAECKAPEVELSQETFFQSAQYLQNQQATYLLLTNGISIFCAKLDSSPILVCFELPHYPKK